MKKSYIFFSIILAINSHITSCNQPTTIFCHGIVDNKTQADRYEDFLQEPKLSFDFPDAQTPSGYNLNNLIFNACNLFGKPVNRDEMYMGHGADIETLQSQIERDKKYILHGVSRGAATATSFIGKYNPENINALIIDAGPADVVASVDEFQHAIGFKFAPDRKTQEYVFNFLFPAYPVGSTPAIDEIANIKNKDLPIFIVHARTDTRVHIRSAWQFYCAFLQAGFKNVYLLELQHGKHAYYMHGFDAEKYLHALHSFYKVHGFAHNPEFATLDNLQKLQPALQDVLYKIGTDKEKMHVNYESQKKLNMTIALLIMSASLWVMKL